MTVMDSPLTSYSDTTPQKRVITDVVALLDPSDAPLVEALGGLDGGAEKFRFLNWPSTTCEWLEDALAPLANALNGSIASNTTTVTVDDASVFQKGHIVEVDSEQMWVSDRDTAGNTITVTRNYGGTQASHADNATATIIGLARLEGADSDPLSFTDRTVGSNYTQIFHKEIKVSRTQNQLSQYGIAQEFDYQASKAVPELMRLVEKQLFKGVRKAGSSTTPRAFGGLDTFITDNTVNAGGAVVQADFDDALEAAYGDGGSGPWIASISPANMQVIKGFLDSSSYLRVNREERKVGMVIETIVTPYGEVDLLLDRWAPNSKIHLVDPKSAGLVTFAPFVQEPLAVDGDYQKGQVVGEFTFACKLDKAHAAITGIS